MQSLLLIDIVLFVICFTHRHCDICYQIFSKSFLYNFTKSKYSLNNQRFLINLHQGALGFKLMEMFQVLGGENVDNVSGIKRL